MGNPCVKKVRRHRRNLEKKKFFVDKKIAFRKEGFFGTQEKYVFVPLEDDNEINNTVALLQDAYYGSTPQ